MTQKFAEYDLPDPAPAGHRSIILPQRQKIIVFGGNESVKFSKYLDTIFVCDMEPEISWRKLRSFKMPYRQWMFGCVVWKSLVIIFGGKQKVKAVKDRNGLTDEIWVLSLKTWEWSRCHMKCPKKAKYYAVKTERDMVHLLEYDGDGGHWSLPISMLVNKPSTTKRKSLEKQVDDLTEKFTKMVMENEGLREQQKDWKHRVKALRAKNKELLSENEALRDDLDALQRSRRSNHDHIQSELLKAGDDYKALTEKYRKLKAMHSASHSASSNGNSNGRSGTTNGRSGTTNGRYPPPQPLSASISQPLSATNPFDPDPFDSNPFGDATGKDDDFWGDANGGNGGGNGPNRNKTGDDFLDSIFT